jgi:putative restriction endonuclease
MGNDPNAADKQWLREAMENRIPVIYFFGIAPSQYDAFFPTFIIGGSTQWCRPSPTSRHKRTGRAAITM